MESPAECQKLFNEPGQAEKWVRTFWSISDFPEALLFEKLKTIADTDFEDDFSEFLKSDHLMQAGLSLLGLTSPHPVVQILAETPDAADRLSRTAELFTGALPGYLASAQADFEQVFPGEKFSRLTAAAALLTVRSRNFLTNWSRNFARIVDHHPAPAQAIRNVLGLVFRGEALIVDNYSTPHRNFNACGKLFMELVAEENADARTELWRKKHQRIMDALGGK